MTKINNPSLFVISLLLLELVCVCCGENVKKNGNGGRDGGNEESNKRVAMENLDGELTAELKTVPRCSARQSHQMHAILNAAPRQFPFVASLLSPSGDHVCSGSLVSDGLVLTTATCVKKQIRSVLLNTIRAQQDAKDAVQIGVIKSEIFPNYTGEETVDNVAVVYTHRYDSSVASTIRISNFTGAQNLGSFEVLGYGLNWEVGHPRELQYVGLENRYNAEAGNTLNGYIDCVEAKEPTCLRDIGGPAVFGNELVGIVTKGQEECTKEMSANDAINKPMATILPSNSFKTWLDEKIRKNEEQSKVIFAPYLSKLVWVEENKPLKKLDDAASKGYTIDVPLISIILTSLYVCFN